MRKTIRQVALIVIVLAFGFVAGHLSAAQPHMQAALKHLRAAQNSLEKASPDKGGHRNRAMSAVREAIVEVERGIAYDRRR